MRRGRDVLLNALQAQGVCYIFGDPGTTELPIMAMPTATSSCSVST
jgi:thiamine pyrophosphate-dependent acetolactate synthase large subunit-like protein